MISDDFGKLMAVLSAAYPATPISRETVLIYAEFLGNIPKERLQAAISKCITECKFFPNISEIKAAAKYIKREEDREQKYLEQRKTFSSYHTHGADGSGQLSGDGRDRRGGGPRMIDWGGAADAIRPAPPDDHARPAAPGKDDDA